MHDWLRLPLTPPCPPAGEGNSADGSIIPSRSAEAAPFLPSHLREGLGEGPSARRALPDCTAAAPHTASPASGGGEFRRALLHHPPTVSGGCSFSPLPLAGGAGGESPGAAGLSRLHGRRPPPGLPRKRGRGIQAAAPSSPLLLSGGCSLSPLPLAGGVGGGSSSTAGLAGLHGRWPPPGLPRKRGRGIQAAAVPSSPPPVRRRPLRFSPSACGRGWGRVLRCSGLCRAAAAVGPHPAFLACGGREFRRWRHHHPPSLPLGGGGFLSPFPPAGGDGGGSSGAAIFAGPRSRCPLLDLPCERGGREFRRRRHHHPPPVRRRPLPFAPPACGRGWGRVFRRGGPCRAARPLSPTRPPPQAGEGRICGGCSTTSSRSVEAAPFLPSRLLEGSGEGFLAPRALPGYTAAVPHPASPASGGGEDLRLLLHHLPPARRRPLAFSPPAGGRGWGRVLRRSGLCWAVAAVGPQPGLRFRWGRGGFAAVVLPTSSRSAAVASFSPPACGRGWGRVSRCGDPCRAARPLAPTRPPPQAGEGNSGGGGFIIPRPARRRPPAFSPRACGRGWGRAFRCGEHCRATRPLSPTWPPP